MSVDNLSPLSTLILVEMTGLDKVSLVSFSSIICPFCFAKDGLCRFKYC
nr:MAG TPA: Thiol:disulfide interchange protein dsbA domain, helical domain insert [Caudoviricetes sp.]